MEFIKTILNPTKINKSKKYRIFSIFIQGSKCELEINNVILPPGLRRI